MSLGTLDQILQRDGFIIYVSGSKEKGKTDFSLLLGEYCYLRKYRTKIGTNIQTESYMVERQVTNLPDLKEWLKESKSKLFILDEAGLSIPKLRFMSAMNLEIMKILQMIRHYDAGFIGIAPSTKNVDSTFMDTDILDAHIKKQSKQVAIVKDYLHGESYFLYDIPKTSINFNSKHIAEFTMNKEADLTKLPLCCRVAAAYATCGKLEGAGKPFGLFPQQVKRLLQEHCRHSVLTINNHPEGIVSHETSLQSKD
jgi:hypothetical protein